MDLSAFFQQYGSYLVSGFSILLDILVLLYAKAKGAAVKKLLAEAKARQTYFICPHCGKAVDLDDVTFLLPGGKADNNLNGVPDAEE